MWDTCRDFEGQERVNEREIREAGERAGREQAEREVEATLGEASKTHSS